MKEKKVLTVVIECNVGYARAEDCKTSIWLVPRTSESIEEAGRFGVAVDKLKILGPIDDKMAEDLKNGLCSALSQLGFEVQTYTTADA